MGSRTFVVAVLAVAVVSACSGSNKGNSAAPPSTTSTTEAPSLSAIGFRASDFPKDWKSTIHSESTADREFGHKLVSCGGTQDTSGDATDSPNFSGPGATTEARSAIVRAPSEAQATAELRGMAGPAYVPCATALIRDQLPAQLPAGAVLSSLSFDRYTGDVPTDRRAAFHMVATIVDKAKSVTLDEHIVFMRSNALEITLVFSATNGAFPADLATKLETAVSQRAAAAA
jgi:hypothetical protein